MALIKCPECQNVIELDWSGDLHDGCCECDCNHEHENEDDFEEIAFFSMGEEELTIQSTYFYLSKSGSRMRNMVFPLSVEEVWNRFDIVITTNKEIIKKKPKGKIVILINKSDNKNLKSKSDYNYDNLETFLGDNETLTKIKNINETQVSLLAKIKQNIRKLIKR